MGFMDKLKQTATSAKILWRSLLTKHLPLWKLTMKKARNWKSTWRRNCKIWSYICGRSSWDTKKEVRSNWLNIMPDKFSFRPTITTKEWFSDYDIPYNKISELRIEKRTISTTEVLLGGGDSANQEQENVICILYTSQDNKS